MHPNQESELTFAIELEGTPYFPVQDYRYNICGLQTTQGSLVQWYRYTSFGLKTALGSDSEALFNPWRFANKRRLKDCRYFRIDSIIHKPEGGLQRILLVLKMACIFMLMSIIIPITKRIRVGVLLLRFQ